MIMRAFFLPLALLLGGKVISQPVDSLVTTASLKEHVTALAHDSMKGRLTTSRELYNAAVYIEKEFKKAGLKPVRGNSGYFWKYYHRGDPGTPGVAANVMGEIPGDTGKLVIFSAHFDHIGTTQRGIFHGAQLATGPDSIYNGANDNASGVAALIELARYYAARKTNEYTVLFIAFSGEETGLTGSILFARETDFSKLVKVINIDMIGRPARELGGEPLIAGIETNNIRKQLNRNLFAADKSYGRNFFHNDPFTRENLAFRGDHASFFFTKGLESFMIMGSSPNDPYYHSVKDETGAMDFIFLQRMVKAIALACEPLLRK